MEEACFLNSDQSHSFSGAIGSHCRHVIEFYEQFVMSHELAIINYDARPRNLALEQSKNLTLNSLLTLINQMEGLVLDENKFVQTVVNDQVYQSSIGRELSYLTEHAVHHFAIIRFLAEAKGFDFKDYSDFGIAQSTSMYRLLQNN